MYKLEVPKVLKRGDTIALISISGGRAGDEDMRFIDMKQAKGDCANGSMVEIDCSRVTLKIMEQGVVGDIFVCGVLPEYQHIGIGKTLYHAAENYFVQKGCKYVGCSGCYTLYFREQRVKVMLA